MIATISFVNLLEVFVSGVVVGIFAASFVVYKLNHKGVSK